MLWTDRSFRCEAMKHDKVRVEARNDALQTVLKQLETELKDCRHKLTETKMKLAEKEYEVGMLKQDQAKIEALSQPPSTEALSDALAGFLEELPVQSPLVEERVKEVLDLTPMSEDRKSGIMAKRKKKPSKLKRLFSFSRKSK
jgi:septal ring factor EnvC (AmiA/AmiB activator)